MQTGAEKLVNLRIFYLSNNKIKDWAEVERLAPLEKLEELLLIGNTLYNDYRDANDIPTYRIEASSASVLRVAQHLLRPFLIYTTLMHCCITSPAE